MNKITLIGNLTQDPAIRSTNSGKSVCTFSLAVKRRFADKTDYFRIQVWGQQGENCKKFLSKGKKAAVSGECQYNSYESSDGSTKYSLDVVADEVEFLSPKTNANDLVGEVTKQMRLDDLDTLGNNDIPF